LFGYIRLSRDKFNDLFKFNKQELEKIKKAFNEKDLDKSGYLSIDEILAMLRESNSSVTMDEAEVYLNKMDTNGDGKVSIDEYVAFLESNA
jgi:Ca2+-binding EF-hand superfamily protein